MADIRTSVAGSLAKAVAKANDGDTVIVDSPVTGTKVAKNIRVAGGKVSGTLVNAAAAVFDELQADSIDYTASDGSEIGCVVRTAPGKGRIVRATADNVSFTDPIADGAGDHAVWVLGNSGFTIHGTLDVRGGGHQNIELFRARNFHIDAIDTKEAASLGVHFLQCGWNYSDKTKPPVREKAGWVGRIGSSHNLNNGTDSHGSTMLELPAVYGEFNGSPGAAEQEGGAEGTGLLLYDSTYITVGLMVGRNNSQGQVGNRDALTLSASGKPGTEGTHHITIGQVVGIDDQAKHTQRWALGFGGHSKGGIHDVTVGDIKGGGNISGLAGVAHKGVVDVTRDNIILPTGIVLAQGT